MIMFVQKYGRKLVKPLRIEKRQNGRKKNSKFDNARRLRGIYFIDPDDQDDKEILKKREEKTGKTYGSSHDVQKDGSYFHHEGGCKAGNSSQKIPKTIIAE